MKTKNLFRIGFILFITCSLLYGCGGNNSDDPSSDPTNQESTSVNIDKLYYIVGKVSLYNGSESITPISGVKVTAGSQSAITDSSGVYILQMPSVGEYNVSFTKDGYYSINDAQAIISSDATNRSMFFLNETMYKSGIKFTIQTIYGNVANEEGFTSIKNPIVGIQFQKKTFNENVDMLIQPYMPGGSNQITSGTSDSFLIMRNVEVNDFGKNLRTNTAVSFIFYVPNDRGNMTSVTLRHLENGVWKSIGNPVYDEYSHGYVYTLSAGSILAGNYQLVTPVNINTGNVTTNTSPITSISYKNISNTEINNYKLTAKYTLGWGYSYDGTYASTQQVTSMRYIVAGEMGIFNGDFPFTQNTYANIPSGYTLNFNNYLKYANISYTFKVNGYPCIVTSKKYIGTSTDFTIINIQ